MQLKELLPVVVTLILVLITATEGRNSPDCPGGCIIGKQQVQMLEGGEEPFPQSSI